MVQEDAGLDDYWFTLFQIPTKTMSKRCCTCSVWHENYCWWHFIDRKPRAIQCNEYKRKFEVDYVKTNKRNKKLQPGEHKEGL